jgi:histone H3/H4
MAKKKVKKAASTSSKEVLVVGSKVRDYVKKKGCMTSSELIGALNEQVYGLLNCAVSRAKGNGRKTVAARDV